MSIALFEGASRVPVMVHPASGEPYRALWVGIAHIEGETYHLIVDISSTVRWIEDDMVTLVTDTKYDPVLEDWVEPDR